MAKSNTPFYIDGCNHEADTYVGSWDWLESLGGGEYVHHRLDIRVYVDHTVGIDVCYRFGSEAHEYGSLPVWVAARMKTKWPDEIHWAIGKHIADRMEAPNA